ncbi:helix-turn-helix transcriptional regulator [Brevibacillus laterosporus]|uniref:helix-turn-helix transcriptional regulator n=3 Tax=Brevibacillus laterosporus TaxID=1465 RepID=UPI000CE4A2C7|nr:AraC family transcriptional regulator [Brevibacillus laterosporus]MBG9775395.1 AraC family transcriptional regulator [Brevibacillus laterosporus]PPA83814.1 AraC family transcriptional regulator [Brevibacillus laterosporus]
MIVRAENTEFTDFNENVLNKILGHSPVESFEHYGRIPSHLGEGYFSCIQLRDGMELQISDMVLHENVSFDVGIRYPHLELAFTIDGGGYFSVDGQNKDIVTEAGSAQLVYLNDTKFHAEHSKEKRFTHLELRMDAKLWGSLFQNVEVRFDQPFFHLQDTIRPKMQVLLQQLRNCSYSGSAKRLYMEGKTLELLALFIYEMEMGQVKKSTSLKKDDIDRIYLARDILVKMLGQPPSLLALSRLIQLNDYKLKIGFKEVFGMTVFEFVRQQRMEKARILLENNSISVSQASSLVGYHNFSHFASLFRKTYGVNPSQYGKNALK